MSACSPRPRRRSRGCWKHTPTRARTPRCRQGQWPCWPACSPRRVTCATASSRSRRTSATWPLVPTSPTPRASRPPTSCAGSPRSPTAPGNSRSATPDAGIGSAGRSLWEGNASWQPARKAVEYALVSYDWGEAFTALNLVLGPTLDNMLLTQLGQVARANGDDLTWLLTSFLAADAQRAARWSRALAELAVAQRPDNRGVLGKWVARWSARADDAAHGLGQFLESLPELGGPPTRWSPRPARPRKTSWAGCSIRPARPRRGRADGGRRRTAQTARTAQASEAGQAARTPQWRETINLDELWEGDMTSVTVEGEDVLLMNVGGQVRAYANTCPHQAGRWTKVTSTGRRWSAPGTCGSRCGHGVRHQPRQREADRLRLQGR